MVEYAEELESHARPVKAKNLRPGTPSPPIANRHIERIALLHDWKELRSSADAGSGDSRERRARSSFERNGIDPGRMTNTRGKFSVSKRGTNFRKVLRSINFSPP
jgi:hypothetical protein